MASAEFSVKVDVDCRCVACGAERDIPDGGRKIAGGESRIVAEAEQACECGERRVKVSWAVGLKG